jgi:Tn3 transposase DDE domain
MCLHSLTNIGLIRQLNLSPDSGTLILQLPLYMEAALHQLRAEGMEVKPEDVARLSPLIHQHINFQGRYSFALSESVARGGWRPLRDPYAQDE